MDKLSPKEIHLLEALLHLLLYIGQTGEKSEILEKVKGLTFMDSQTPPVDYGRPKYLMGG